MMKATLKYIVSTIATLMMSTLAFANPNLVFDPAPIINLQVSENDKAIIAVARYPNGCYEAWDTFKKVKDNRIIMTHIATYEKGAICTRQVLYQQVRISIRGLEEGTYKLVDASDGEVIGELEKQEDEAKLTQFISTN